MKPRPDRHPRARQLHLTVPQFLSKGRNSPTARKFKTIAQNVWWFHRAAPTIRSRRGWPTRGTTPPFWIHWTFSILVRRVPPPGAQRGLIVGRTRH
jgi:hypothetical protein